MATVAAAAAEPSAMQPSVGLGANGAGRPMEPLAAAGPVHVVDKISLTEHEEQLFQLLLGAARHHGLATQLRVAGGWVRDKLLGRESHDIDIALDDMLGREFGEKVNEYLALKGMQTHKVGVIDSNPEQSKHLETAAMRVLDQWIDLVNLRSEAYAQDSRIPTMEFGTPEQDAFRRDLTINSLFYNINTGCVEDFTQRGVADLRAGLVRTPLPPRETFLDDPLRVLRAVRFASRFGFAMDEELTAAAASEEVRRALASKVSRERIGTEVDLMLVGAGPMEAVRQIVALGLFDTIFALPPALQEQVGDATPGLCEEVFKDALAVAKASSLTTLSEGHMRLLKYAALMLPLRALSVPLAKNKDMPATTHIIRESLKLKAKDADNVVALHSAAVQFSRLQDVLLGPGSSTDDAEGDRRVAAGLLLREVKDLWRAALLLSASLAMPAARAVGVEAMEDSAGKPLPAEERAARSDLLAGAILARGLDGVWELKPLLDGKAVMAASGLKGGPQLGQLMAEQTRWQLRHPNGTAAELRSVIEAGQLLS